MLFDSQQSITGGDRTLSQSTLAIVAKRLIAAQKSVAAEKLA